MNSKDKLQNAKIKLQLSKKNENTEENDHHYCDIIPAISGAQFCE